MISALASVPGMSALLATGTMFWHFLLDFIMDLFSDPAAHDLAWSEVGIMFAVGLVLWHYLVEFMTSLLSGPATRDGAWAGQRGGRRKPRATVVTVKEVSTDSGSASRV